MLAHAGHGRGGAPRGSPAAAAYLPFMMVCWGEKTSSARCQFTTFLPVAKSDPNVIGSGSRRPRGEEPVCAERNLALLLGVEAGLLFALEPGSPAQHPTPPCGTTSPPSRSHGAVCQGEWLGAVVGGHGAPHVRGRQEHLEPLLLDDAQVEPLLLPRTLFTRWSSCC